MANKAICPYDEMFQLPGSGPHCPTLQHDSKMCEVRTGAHNIGVWMRRLPTKVCQLHTAQPGCGHQLGGQSPDVCQDMPDIQDASPEKAGPAATEGYKNQVTTSISVTQSVKHIAKETGLTTQNSPRRSKPTGDRPELHGNGKSAKQRDRESPGRAKYRDKFARSLGRHADVRAIGQTSHIRTSTGADVTGHTGKSTGADATKGGEETKVKRRHRDNAIDKSTVKEKTRATTTHADSKRIHKRPNNKENTHQVATDTNPLSLGPAYQTAAATQHTSPLRSLSFLQINLQFCRAATALAADFMKKNGIEIALLQDPYVREGKISGFPASWYTILSTERKAGIIIARANSEPLLLEKGSHHVTIRLTTNKEQLDITSVYAPPSQDIQDILIQISLQGAQHNIEHIFGGDFNAHHPLWGGEREDGRGNSLLEYTVANWLLPLNTDTSIPTFETQRAKGTPDATFATPRTAHSIIDWEVLEDETASDHRYILFKLGEHTLVHRNSHRYKTKYGGHTKLIEILKPQSDSLIHCLQTANTACELDEATNLLVTTIQSACNRTYKKKTNKRMVKNLWWTPQLECLKRKQRALRRRIQRETDPSMLHRLKTIYNKERSLFKKDINNTRKSKWREFCENIEERYGMGFKIAHDKIYHPLPFYSQTNAPAQTATSERVALIQKIFPKAVTQSPLTHSHAESIIKEPEVTLQEVSYAVSRLRSKKAPGPDKIDGYIVKAIHQAMPELFLSLVRKALQLRHFPKALKITDVVLFLKSNKNPLDYKSYRPICLLPILGKLIEKVIIPRLLYHLHQKNPLSIYQHGFLRGKSIETALLDLTSKINDIRTAKHYGTLVSLDIEGAFDTLGWDIILQALIKKNCPNPILQILASYLSDRYIKIAENEYWMITRGCPQGSCLGPILWAVAADSVFYIDWGPGVHLQAYADDFALLAVGITRRQLEIETNTALEKFKSWADHIRLRVSSSKTEAIVFGVLRRPPTLRFNNISIPIRSKLKYLGVVIDTHLNWIEHTKAMRNKALQKTKFMMLMTGKTWGLTGPLLRTWYLTVVEKILLYAAPIWAPNLHSHAAKCLRTAQRHFMLQIARCYKNLSTDALNIVTGLPPILLMAEKLANQGQFIRFKEDKLGQRRRDYDALLHYINIHPALENTSRAFNETAQNKQIEIYTDGSRTPEGTGSAFIVYEHGVIIDKWSEQLRPDNSSFQAELTALTHAMKWCITHPRYRGFKIHTDSQAVIKALQKIRPTSGLVQEAKSILRNAGVTLEICWVKAHVGQQGNEAADCLAKEAAHKNTSHRLHIPLPLSHFKGIAKSSMLQAWQVSWDHSEKGRHLYEYAPKVNLHGPILDRRLIAFFTNHGPFAAGLHRFGLSPTEDCTCGGVATPYHYATECPLTSALHIKRPGSANVTKWKETLYGNERAHKKLIAITQYVADNKQTLQNTTGILNPL